MTSTAVMYAGKTAGKMLFKKGGKGGDGKGHKDDKFSSKDEVSSEIVRRWILILIPSFLKGPYYYIGPVYDKHTLKPLRDRKGRLVIKEQKKSKAYFMAQGIPEADAELLVKIKKRAMLLDGGRKVAGLPIPVGLSAAIGLIPAAGDAVDGLLAFLLTRTARGVTGGLDPWIQKRMMANVAFDVIIGLTPVLGDIADMLYKCNTRNTVLLEKMLRDRANKAMRAAEEEYKMHHGHPGGAHDANPNHPARLAGSEDSDSSRGTPNGSIGAMEMQEQPKRSWTAGFGSKSGKKKNGLDTTAPAQSNAPPHSNSRQRPNDMTVDGARFANVPARSDSHQPPKGKANAEGGRFINARDLL